MIRRNVLSVMTLTLTLLSLSNAKIMRNKALMSKMMTNFRNDNDISVETGKPISVVNTMQNLLCKNFPSIPCELITQDKTLKKLIEKSIQKITDKRRNLEKTTQDPGYLTLFPVANSDDLSNFIETKDDEETPKKTIIHKRKFTQEKKNKRKKIFKKSKQTSVYSKKKLRKFYPHKVKYKDKIASGLKEEVKDNSDEHLSMSVEVPDTTWPRKHQLLSYKMEPEEPPVWRIDYLKHGEPSMKMFDFNNAMYKGIKTIPNADKNIRQLMGRRDVLHPDLYINKNFIRKKNIGPDVNSDGVE